jgi:hypothetical protein
MSGGRNKKPIGIFLSGQYLDARMEKELNVENRF